MLPELLRLIEQSRGKLEVCRLSGVGNVTDVEPIHEQKWFNHCSPDGLGTHPTLSPYMNFPYSDSTTASSSQSGAVPVRA